MVQIRLSRHRARQITVALVAVIGLVLVFRGLYDGSSPQGGTTVSSAAKQETVATKPAKVKTQPKVKQKPANKPKVRSYKLAWKHDGPGSVKVMVLGKTPRNLAKPGQLKAGTRVQLTAAPGDGWFYTWGGSCHGSNLVCMLSMTQMKSVNAVFKPNPDIPVTVPSGVVVAQPAPTTTLHPDPPPKGNQPTTPDNPPAAKADKPGTRKLIPPPLPLPPPTTTEGG